MNIGIEVRAQEVGFMRHGSNPRGTLQEIGSDAREYVQARVRRIVPAVFERGVLLEAIAYWDAAANGPTDVAAYEVYDPRIEDGWYRFDVRCFSNGRYLPEDGGAQIIGALAAWACLHFNHEEGVVIRTYWSS